MGQEIEMYNVDWTSPIIIKDPWYTDVCQYLENGIVPSHLSARQKKALRLEVLSY